MRFTCGKSATRKSGDFDVYFVALDGEWVNFDTRIRNLNGASSRRIELPAVPRTDELSLINDAGAEWTTSVRTNIVHRRKLTADSRHAILSAVAPEFLCSAFRGHVTE